MLVSVIVPVYKAEKWLHRCVDSILAQTMEDFELLLIDDGSPDRSGEICDEYAAKDLRVRVFHKENGGVSSARNLGLDNAQGEWISFVDSDDWVDLDYLVRLTEILDADFITGGMRDTQGNVCVAENRLYFNFDIREFISQHNGDFFLRAACGKLLRREIIEKNRIRFDENVRFGEDTIFNKQVLLCSSIVRIVNSKGYIYYTPIVIDVNLKYMFSFEEMYNKINKIKTINRSLSDKFGCYYDENELVELLFILYPLSKINNKKLFDDFYEFYIQLIKEVKKEELYYELSLFLLSHLIFRIKNIYKLKKYELLKNREEISIWVEDMPIFINFKFKDFYLWYFLIKCRMWWLLDKMLKFYYKIKK